jgi:hypothetical protein
MVAHVHMQTVLKFFAILTCCSLLLFGCASQEIKPLPQAGKWEGEMTGEADGDLEVIVTSEETGAQGQTIVEGTFFVTFKRVSRAAGPCKATLKVRGSIKDRVFNASASGYADCQGQTQQGAAIQIDGVLTGKGDDNRASGTYTLKGRYDTFSGEWKLRKVTP